ncbi:MAG: glycoside hydrolase family 2 protein [Anaerolinea sp.]|nr:glycoside hydrolase family 2 protein [Anaerolinea sp.]
MHVIHLPAGWRVKQRNAALDLTADFRSAEGWLPAAVPGSVHQDLLAAERIPDPFFGQNEADLQWIGESDWLYECTFEVSAPDLKAGHIDLCADGLDTFAVILLNGQQIAVSENMFVPLRVAVKPLLRVGINTLQIAFESAWRKGKELESRYGKRMAWNGDASRVYVRKAQYHYGWDWGPVLITAGIWRDIRLESYSARIAEVHIPAEVSADLERAVLPVKLRVEHPNPAGLSARFSLLSPEGKTLESLSLSLTDVSAECTFTVPSPTLWYPRGYGSQPRYRVITEVFEGDQLLDSQAVLIGLRRLRLVQEPIPGEAGTSFTFEINNIPVFCAGANWIPADSFTPRVTAADYRAWLQLAVQSNMMMVRVWGGGIYEEDLFYDLCDELGLLVWQDFMFACGMYPAHPEFLANVKAEAEANLRRLRHHPSIVLWCGNNEDYQIAETQNAYDSHYRGDFTQSAFPAREIYERLLPQICAAFDPTRPYWQGSPYGGSGSSDPTVGDRHSWEVWHGQMEDYRHYERFSGRFVSEFGMQAAPDRPTLEAFTDPQDRLPNSTVITYHNKAGDGPWRLNHYLNQNLEPSTTLDEYVYRSQFIQAEAVSAAYKVWMRRWGVPGQRRTSGALVWQLNDCYPVISWALVDYFKRAKGGYYRTRRNLAPITVGAAVEQNNIALWGVNLGLEPLEAALEVVVWSFEGEVLHRESRQVNLEANASTTWEGLNRASLPSKAVIEARLIREGKTLARTTLWPEPPKDYPLPDPGLKVTRVNARSLRLSVSRPARGVLVSSEAALLWSDNMLDLLPDEDQIISASANIEGDDLTIHWLGAGSPLRIRG